jgi:hypothetical protein
MTSPSWDEYVAGDDLGVTASESDVAYAGFDAAAASAVTTDLVDAVITDEPADAAAAETAAAGTAADGAATAQDWADWNTATAAGYPDLAANAMHDAAYQAGDAGDHDEMAGDFHAAASDLHAVGEDDNSDPDSSQ